MQIQSVFIKCHASDIAEAVLILVKGLDKTKETVVSTASVCV